MRTGIWAFLMGASLLLSPNSPAVEAESFDEEQAVQRALATSCDLTYQNTLLSAKELAFQLSIRGYLPKLSLAYDDSTTVSLGSADSRAKNLSASVTQSLFKAGSTLFDRPIGALELKIARSEGEQKTQALINGVRQAFGGLCVASQKRDIFERTLALARQNLAIAQEERRLGSVLDVDVMDMEVQVLDLELNLEDTENSLNTARYQLSKILSLEPDTPLDLKTVPGDNYLGLDLVGAEQTLISLVLDHNLELKKQDFTLAQTEAKIRQAGLSLIPNVDLELSASFTGVTFPLRNPNYGAKLSFSFPFPESPTTYSASGFGTADRQKGAGFSVKTNPLDNLSAWLDTRTAGLALEAEVRKKEQMTKDLEFQVRQMVGDYLQTERALDLAERKWKIQQKKLLILKSSMELGETKRIDYLKGVVDTSHAEIAVAQARQKLKANDTNFQALCGLDDSKWQAKWPLRIPKQGKTP